MVLPYVINSDGKTIPSPNIETASIICLAVSRRGKRGLLRREPEKIKFVSKIYSSIYIVPWNDRGVVLDGLGVSSLEFTRSKIPDILAFAEDLEKNSGSRQSFRKALLPYIEKFNRPKLERVIIKYVFSDGLLLADVQKHLMYGNLVDFLPQPSISPLATETERLKEVNVLVSQYEKILDDLEALNYALTLLRKKYHFHQHKLRREIKFMQIEHQSELSKAEFEADKIVVKLKKEHEMKVKELSETTLQQLKASEKEVGPLEYKLKHLLALESNYLRKINSAKDKRKDALNKKLKRVQSQISEMKRALSNSKKQIDLIKKQKESKLKALKDEYDKLINTQLKRIESMKSSFAFEIQKRKAEMEALKKEVISLNDSIKALINRKKEEMQKLRNSTIPWSSTDILQINIPTYLVVYEADGKYRYEVFTPIDIQETEGLIESFQRKILGFKSRMKLFFKPRTKNLDIYISQTLTKRLSTDASFEKEVYEKCLNVNILYSPELIYLLTDGLEEFKGRKWVSAEEISEIKSSIGEK